MSAQDKPGGDKVVKSTFSDPGVLETQQDPVDYRSGDGKNPQKQPDVSAPSPDSGKPPAEDDKIPSDRALPRLQIMEKEALEIMRGAVSYFQKLQESRKIYSLTILQNFASPHDGGPTKAYDYFVQHHGENGVPDEWIEYAAGRKEIPSFSFSSAKKLFDIPRLPSFAPFDSLNGVLDQMRSEAYTSQGESIWGGEQTLSGASPIPFGAFYNYHVFAIKHAVTFVKGKGFAPRRDLEQMEKGFKNWRESEPMLRDLTTKSILLDMDLAGIENSEVAIWSNLPGDNPVQAASQCPEYDKVFEAYPIPEPDEAWIAAYNPGGYKDPAQCRSFIFNAWKMLHEFCVLFDDAAFLGYRRFFRMFGESQSEIKKVPGAGDGEII